MFSRVSLDEHLVLAALHGMLLVISMKPPDDHGSAPNVDLCLSAFIFLAFPFALSFSCLPSHPESARCDFLERNRASGATGLGSADRTFLFARKVGPSPRVAESLRACHLIQIYEDSYWSYEETLGDAVRAISRCITFIRFCLRSYASCFSTSDGGVSIGSASIAVSDIERDGFRPVFSSASILCTAAICSSDNEFTKSGDGLAQA